MVDRFTLELTPELAIRHTLSFREGAKEAARLSYSSGSFGDSEGYSCHVRDSYRDRYVTGMNAYLCSEIFHTLQFKARVVFGQENNGTERNRVVVVM